MLERLLLFAVLALFFQTTFSAKPPPPSPPPPFIKRAALCLLTIISTVVASVELVSRIPPQSIYGRLSESIPVSPESDGKNIVIIFPGYGGPDANTDALLKSVILSDKRAKVQRTAFVIDWSEWRGNLLRAALDSQAVGREVSKTLLSKQRRNITHIHVIGISVGAFAADALTNAIKRSRHGAVVHLTLLDPFCSRGVFDHRYGVRRFGKDADFCDHFLNTDDPVPFTNAPLQHGHVYDVTNAPSRADFTPLPNDNMHSWPG
jgi:hypothetical protein